MMQHVYRSQYSQHIKCLYNTETILTVQQHFMQSCIVSGQCGFDIIDGGIGQYFTECVSIIVKPESKSPIPGPNRPKS